MGFGGNGDLAVLVLLASGGCWACHRIKNKVRG
jgi:hypothetical protein